jgi:hypothetical protein
MMDERFYSAVASEMQGLALSAESARRAGETALAIQGRIAQSSRSRFAFDDSPFDYRVLLAQAAKRAVQEA